MNHRTRLTTSRTSKSLIAVSVRMMGRLMR